MKHLEVYETLLQESFSQAFDKQDISKAKELTAQSTQQDFIKAVGLDPKIFFRLYHTLHEIIWNKDGTISKFAKEYGIQDFKTLYKFLRDQVKPLIRNDHLVEAFNYVKQMYMVAYPKAKVKLFTNVQEPDASVYAINYTQKNIWYALDNLRTLLKVFKIMQYMEENKEYKQTMFELEKKFGANKVSKEDYE